MTAAAAADRGPSRSEAAGRVGVLYERHARMVYGICRAMLRDGHEAEDATQQVFLAAYQALLGGATVHDPARWLAAIARNECRARITEGMRRPLDGTDENLELLPALGDDYGRWSQLDELRSAFGELPARQREAVVLRYVYGLRYREVGAALGLSLPATEALLFRARRALHVRLRPVVGATLVVPSVIREELAVALPGFGGGASAGLVAAGVTGGALAKLTAGPVGVKVAMSAAAISTVGAVGAVPSESVQRPHQGPPALEARSRPESQQRLTVATGVEPDAETPATSPGERSSSSVRRQGSASDERSDSGRSDETSDGRGGSSGSRSGPGGGEPTHGDASIEQSGGSSGPSESSGSSGSSNATEESSSGESSGSSGEGSGSSREDSGSSGPSH